MSIKKLARALIYNGIDESYSDELKRQIEIANFLGLLYILFTIPFLIMNLKDKDLAILAVRSQPIFAGLTIILLLYWHKHRLARLVASISFPILIYIMGVLLLIDDGTFGMAPKFWIIGSIAIPFLLFDYTDWKYIITSVIIDIILYLSFDKVNLMFNLPGLTENLDKPQMRIIAGMGAMTMIALISFYVKKQLYERNKRLATQATDLLEINQELKTAEEELRQNNEELITLNEALTEQKEIVAQALEDVRASLNYAKSIQKAALMPMIPVLEKYFKEYFIIFKPREQVGGDFYYFDEKEGVIILAVGDATGHGIPGAMLSMLGISILENLIHHNSQNPAQVLNDFRRSIIRSLHQQDQINQDTIDLGLACIEENFTKVVYAGANIPLYILRNGEVIRLEGNRMPIGTYLRKEDFSQIEYELQKGDILYLFTDGFRDQLGGENDRKLGRRNFINILKEISSFDLKTQEKLLTDILQQWQKDNPQTDDITVVAVKI